MRCLTNGLSFTATGYESANDVLKKRYDQESEVVAHIQVMNHPSISDANPV